MDLKNTFKQAEIRLKEAAPDILFFAGIALNAAAVIMFCKKSHETEPIVENFTDAIEKAKEDHEDGISNDRQYRKIVISETVETAKNAARTYWLPTLLWGTSVGLVTGSHYILKDRAVTYAAIASGLGMELRNLRQRIIDRYGEDAEKELSYPEVETKQIDEKTGDEIIESHDAPLFTAPGGMSVFAKYFDDSCPAWKRDSGYNLSWLLLCEHEINKTWRSMKKGEKLRINDIYEKCTMAGTDLGAISGYVKGDPYAPEYISFGIFDIYSQGQRDAVNGYQSVFLINPTTPTIIYDTEEIVKKIGYEKRRVLLRSLEG